MGKRTNFLSQRLLCRTQEVCPKDYARTCKIAEKLELIFVMYFIGGDCYSTPQISWHGIGVLAAIIVPTTINTTPTDDLLAIADLFSVSPYIS